MTQVYHGSPNNFKKFSYDRIAENGTSEGIGFYFTDNETIARHYATKKAESGYLYFINFTGKKSLSITKKTITKKQLRVFLSHLGSIYLDNWGDSKYEGKNHLLNLACDNEFEHSDSDVDIICSILHGCGHYEFILETLNRVLGYDSIIVESPEWGYEQKIYIALVHSAYEILEIKEIN